MFQFIPAPDGGVFCLVRRGTQQWRFSRHLLNVPLDQLIQDLNPHVKKHKFGRGGGIVDRQVASDHQRTQVRIRQFVVFIQYLDI